MSEMFISVFSSIFGIVATVISIILERKNRKLRSKLSKFTWQDIQLGVDHLVKETNDFCPDFVLAPSNGASGIVANLYLVKMDRYIPIMYGNHKKMGDNFTANVEGKYGYTTSKWQVYFSNDIEKYTDKKILVIQDVVLSGDSLQGVREALKKCGYSEKNVRFAALFVSTVSINSNKQPDYYWYHLDDSVKYYYPWGRFIYGKGYDQ